MELGFHDRVRSGPDITTPQLPLVWSAIVNITELINGHSVMPIGEERQIISQDDARRRGLQHMSTKVPFAPSAFTDTPLEWVNVTQFRTDQFFGISLNGQKLDGNAAYGAGYHSLTSWVKHASRGPNVTINGTSLESWGLTTPTASLQLLLDADGTPRVLTENITVKSREDGYLYRVRYAFETFTPNGSLPGIWDHFDEDAFLHPRPCVAPDRPMPPAVNKTLYIYHPKARFNLTQQDVASIAGDTLFVCAEGRSGGAGQGYEWISQYEIEHVPNYGQYQNCNGYDPPKCMGAENFWVGHEAAMGLGPASGGRPVGQCVSNPHVGEWYSLPSGGKCASTHAPGDGTCTWRALRVKTIDSACLFEPSLGFFSACEADARAPFASANKVFRAAFETDDPNQGGCPSLPGPGAARSPESTAYDWVQHQVQPRNGD